MLYSRPSVGVINGVYQPAFRQVEEVEAELQIIIPEEVYVDTLRSPSLPMSMTGSLASMIAFHKSLGASIADAQAYEEAHVPAV